MCEIVDNYIKEEKKEIAKKLFELGVDFDAVCYSVGNIPVEELKIIYEEVKGNA